jgi:hypothetical protein
MDPSDSVKNISTQDIIYLQQLLCRELCYRQIEEKGLDVTELNRFTGKETDLLSLYSAVSLEVCYRRMEEEGLHVSKFNRFNKEALQLLVDHQPRNLNKEFDESLNFTILDFMSAKINNEFKHKTTNKFDSVDFSLDDFIRSKELKKAQKSFNTPKKSRRSKRKFSI